MWSVPSLGTSQHFWESECDNIKTQLITMDKRGTGRAPLSRFSVVFVVMVSSRSTFLRSSVWSCSVEKDFSQSHECFVIYVAAQSEGRDLFENNLISIAAISFRPDGPERF